MINPRCRICTTENRECEDCWQTRMDDAVQAHIDATFAKGQDPCYQCLEPIVRGTFLCNQCRSKEAA